MVLDAIMESGTDAYARKGQKYLNLIVVDKKYSCDTTYAADKSAKN